MRPRIEIFLRTFSLDCFFGLDSEIGETVLVSRSGPGVLSCVGVALASSRRIIP